MRKHNIWTAALWVIGVVLAAAGYGAGLWQASFYYQSSYIANPGAVVQFFQQLADVMKAPAITVGFATIGGLLFLHARNHARKVSRQG